MIEEREKTLKEVTEERDALHTIRIEAYREIFRLNEEIKWLRKLETLVGAYLQTPEGEGIESYHAYANMMNHWKIKPKAQP